MKQFYALIKRSGVILSVLLTFMMGVWGFDAYMSKYAIANDVNNIRSAVGGLIEVHKQIASYQKNSLIGNRLDKIGDRIANLEEKYLAEMMPPPIKRYYRKLQQQLAQLEKQIIN